MTKHNHGLEPPIQNLDPLRSEAPTSSSAHTSDRLTPDSADDSDDGMAMELDGVETYELQDQRAFKSTEDEGEGDDPGASDIDEAEVNNNGWKRRRRRASDSTAASFQLYTPDEERTVVKKFDRKLVIFVAFLYMLSFLDRSNIGNARIAGMDDDLQSVPRWDGWYEWALTAFYIAYIAFEWMSLLWKLIPAHIFVSMIVLSWGLTAALQAVAVNYSMLIFLRTVLGIGEAAFTGIPLFLSFFFKRDELAFRTAIFISAAPLATSFASSLAWGIMKVGEAGPIAPWRLLFLIEGFPAVLVAVVAWNVIPDSPQTASYLTPRERKVARLRLRHDCPDRPSRKSGPASDTSSRFKADDVFSVLRDPAAWTMAAMFFLTNMAYSSLPVFLPTILTAMGHDALSSQALAAPPYLAAFAIVLATARASDSMRSRAPLVAAHALASSAGYGVLALSASAGWGPGNMLRYAAVYPAAVGFFGVVVLVVAWAVNNQRSHAARGGGFALLQLVGQCGPLVGTRLYPDADAPFYTRGMAVCSGAMLTVAVLALGLRAYLARQNRRMDLAERMEEEGQEVAGEEEIGLVRSGKARKRSETYRYML